MPGEDAAPTLRDMLKIAFGDDRQTMGRLIERVTRKRGPGMG